MSRSSENDDNDRLDQTCHVRQDSGTFFALPPVILRFSVNGISHLGGIYKPHVRGANYGTTKPANQQRNP